jgi:hypothetical protein
METPALAVDYRALFSSFTDGSGNIEDVMMAQAHGIQGGGKTLTAICHPFTLA